MRIALISDIHGNCFALDAILADIHSRSIEQIVCLGDAIQGGPQPAEVAQRLRKLACPVIMGNADAWLLTGHDTRSHEEISPQQIAVKEWSLAQLSATDRAFIEQFLPSLEIALEAPRKLLCFHGSPRSFDDILLPDTSEEAFPKQSFAPIPGPSMLLLHRKVNSSAWSFSISHSTLSNLSRLSKQVGGRIPIAP